ARLEGLTRELRCDIIVSREVGADLRDEDARWTRSLGEIFVKGRSQPVEIMEVFATDDAALRDDKRRTASALTEALGQARSGRTGDAVLALERLAEAQPRDFPVA